MPYCTWSRVYTFCKDSAQNNSSCIAKLFAVVRVKVFFVFFFCASGPTDLNVMHFSTVQEIIQKFWL